MNRTGESSRLFKIRVGCISNGVSKRLRDQPLGVVAGQERIQLRDLWTGYGRSYITTVILTCPDG